MLSPTEKQALRNTVEQFLLTDYRLRRKALTSRTAWDERSES